jgi:protein-tyrosine phosphatase
MIDFHTHILPSIDDGAENVDVSLAILKSLEEQGVTKVVLTPHYYGRTRNIEQFLKAREGAFEKLSATYGGTIQLFKGSECNVSTCANNDLSELKALKIQNTNYILTEMSFEKEWSDRLLKRVATLADDGLTPIIAHVELYPAVNKNPSYVRDLIAMGCAIQINCNSFLSDDTYPLVRAIIEHGQAHVLGSDTHNMTKRPPNYKKATEKIEADFGREVLDNLQGNMAEILDGGHINTSCGTPIKKRLLGGYK